MPNKKLEKNQKKMEEVLTQKQGEKATKKGGGAPIRGGAIVSVNTVFQNVAPMF